MKIEIYTCEPKELIYEWTADCVESTIEKTNHILQYLLNLLNLTDFSNHIVRIDYSDLKKG